MSNSNRISIDNLSEEIYNMLFNYKEEIEEDVKEISDEMTKQAKIKLKRISPKKTAKYSKSWTIKTGQKAKEIYSKVVYNKDYYRLTHLLEFRHHKRDGTGWVEAQPHIRKTEEEYKEKFVQELKRKTRR